MSAISDRQQYREAVAHVAALAKAKLPQAINGRLESAVKLVLAYDVMPQPDGSILVGSSSDAMKSYLLVGPACECQDFVHGQAPEGWCQHRIAAGIQKRVQEMLPQSPDGETEAVPSEEPPPAAVSWTREQAAERAGQPPVPAGEPMFSLTLKGRMGGCEDAMLTVRGWSLAEFQANLAAVRGLIATAPAPSTSPAQSQPSQAPDAPPQCPQHGAMKPSTRGKGWYCPHKTADGQWCKA